jgi:hypothetical protein
MKYAAFTTLMCILPIAVQAYEVSAHEQLTKNTFAEYAHDKGR